ncbi:ABC transporter ATP-binding protein [Lutispora saccharofermentans]|uniref:ATP-binding cassette domain-containing protein n=1 Tax=Lutispora saccharofermentans TaxID=3024236 RepID=A0ABT1NIR2_9FIRM|nr:ATP-binding cassette domain-containing protein [Lutispora saccharofermentans]MCQ1531103.1 ATP-binding cassette domain-containing protein [Lutispora saccharofermentans]
MEVIKVENLKKVYRIPKRREGFLNTFKDLIKHEYEDKTALADISFSINEGDIVGYIGPNGAGKSTTIKIMAGILYPTSGQVTVNEVIPYKEKVRNAKEISLIAGNRSNLYWDLPIIDTFELMKRIYKISDKKYKQNLDLLSEVIGIKDLHTVPARQLSLGQRMRADFVASMLHDPKIVYLDEPTIGLDIVAKDHIREFIKTVNSEKRTTVIITSHDIADIERICNRVIVIDYGKIIYSGNIDNLNSEYNNNKCIMKIKLEDKAESFNLEGFDVKQVNDMYSISFERKKITPSGMLNLLLEKGYKIIDFSLTEPSLEDTIKAIYEK